MRIDVTPLGATSRSVAAVARAVVDYLEGGVGDPGAGLFANAGAGPAAEYYGDSPEGPGRWVGSGAEFQHLRGTVDRDAFTRILEGRHPETGARLITARGSSQRSHLDVGAAARYDVLGQALYDVADAAALLGVSNTDAADMVAAADGRPVDIDDRGALRTVVVDGVSYVPDSEIGRHLELAAKPATAAQVLAAGSPGDLLTVAQAAAALGVSPQYVRRLCARPSTRNDDGAELRAARLAARKDGRGSYRIRRQDLADFAARRRPPVARVGYDLTLTVEKSVGIVMMLAPEHIGQRFVDALDVANTTAFGHLDRHAAVARRRGEVVGSESLVGASYFHATSRALDPHPHRHNVIANAVVDDEGGIRALDARALYREGRTAAALATSAARWELGIAGNEMFSRYLEEPIHLPPNSRDDTSLTEWIRSKHEHYWHPAGTCRMGPDSDPNSVVDGAGRVHGVDGLHVADASIFPDIPRSTPTLPTVVVGERIADGILGKIS